MNGVAADVLVVDDEPTIGTLVGEILTDEGYSVRTAVDGEAARRAMRCRRPDLVLLDVWMPDADGISLLQEWSRAGRPPCPVVMISGHGTIETALEATRLGAWDFLEKPLSMPKLLLTVERALEADRLALENEGLRVAAPTLPEPLGCSEAMEDLRSRLRRIAGHDNRVLLTGEPGSGKRCLAAYLHGLSAGESRPFTAVTAARLSGDAGMAELFGHERDGAISYGVLEQAKGGTLYIAEAADLDGRVQARLLAAIRDGAFRREGGNSPVPLAVRIVAGTVRDLGKEAAAGRFREPLYYELAEVAVDVPPLRTRREDIPELLSFYAAHYAERDRLPYRAFADAALERLCEHDWPGNIRELQNVVQRLLIFSTEERIEADEVEALLATPINGNDDPHGELKLPLREAREQFERRYLRHQLQRAQGSVARLARLTGMERTHLYRKLKALGIDPKEKPDPS